MTNKLVPVCRALSFATFVVMIVSLIYLWSEFAARAPAAVDHITGAVFPFSVKGRLVYITEAQANQYSACWLIAFATFVTMILCGPKRLLYPRSAEERSRWRQVGMREVEDEGDARGREAVFFGGLVVVAAIAWFLGYPICELFAEKVGVLNF